MDLQDSVQRSLQNPAEKILQICTDSQRSKTWVSNILQNKLYFSQNLIDLLNTTKSRYKTFHTASVYVKLLSPLVTLRNYPGWNCLNFLQVFVGYQATFS